MLASSLITLASMAPQPQQQTKAASGSIIHWRRFVII
jgi:hypothetical protein